MKHIHLAFFCAALLLVSSGCKNPTELDGEPPIVIKDPVPAVALMPIEVKGDGDYDGFTDEVRWMPREFRRLAASIDTSDEKNVLLTLRGSIAASLVNFSPQKIQPGRVFHEIKEIVIKCDSLPVGQPYLRDDLIANKVEVLFLIKTYDRKMNGVLDTNSRYIPLSDIDSFSTFSMRIRHNLLLPNSSERKLVIVKCDFSIFFPQAQPGSKKVRLNGRSELFFRMP
ncbi:MAG: hypothetical protein IPK11_03950 [Ignavibacteria bacterium]|nr:hypothetical protein [Ignavibacteria bacterium]